MEINSAEYHVNAVTKAVFPQMSHDIHGIYYAITLFLSLRL